MAYDQLGAGIASAGQSVAAGLQMREDRKWREKTFEEQKRQFEIGEANKVKAANMKAGVDFLGQLESIYKEGGDPEGLNQLAASAINSINTGEPLNFDAIARIQQAQKNLEQPVQFQQTGEVDPNFDAQVEIYSGADMRQDRMSQAINPAPADTEQRFNAGMQNDINTPFKAPTLEQKNLRPAAYEPPKVFPTLYDRVSKVSSPKAVQVRALKPQEQIKLFREKPINFDAAVKDGLKEGYITPAHAGEYYEAQLLGKSDEELAAIMRKMWRDKPLSEDEKARLAQSKDAQKSANLEDYIKLINSENDIILGSAKLYAEYQKTLAEIEQKEGKDAMSSPLVMEIRDKYEKEEEKFKKRLTKISQAKYNYGHYIKKMYGIDLDEIKNLKEGQKFFEDRVKELTRRSLPAATVEQSVEEKVKAEEQARKEVLENFGFDIAKTRSPQPDLTEDERIDNEFDALLEANQRKTGDRNRAGLAAIAELLKKYPNNEMLKAAQVEIANRMRQ